MLLLFNWKVKALLYIFVLLILLFRKRILKLIKSDSTYFYIIKNIKLLYFSYITVIFNVLLIK